MCAMKGNDSDITRCRDCGRPTYATRSRCTTCRKRVAIDREVAALEAARHRAQLEGAA